MKIARSSLLIRSNRNNGLRLAIVMATVLTGATLVLAASLDAGAGEPTRLATLDKGEASPVSPAPTTTSQAKPARQVRIIPLWNVPAEQQGL